MNSINDIALKLAEITGKPVTNFIKSNGIGFCECGLPWDSDGVCHGNHEEREQTKEENLEKRENISPMEIQVDIGEIRDNKEKGIKNKVQRPDVPAEVLEQYGGEAVNGKILRGSKQMSRKEYLAEKRKFKTVDDLWQSPLIYLMFRSEGQPEANFVIWVTTIEKELIKNESKK